MSLELYKIFHILGLAFIFVALGGTTLLAYTGGDPGRGKKLAGMAHGLGLLLMLISGFGMLARLHLGFPPWVWVKLLIWLTLGAVAVLLRKKPGLAGALWFALPLVAAFAAYLALYKPF
jgi:hypothetical protein